jgi:hypothetical protein
MYRSPLPLTILLVLLLIGCQPQLDHQKISQSITAQLNQGKTQIKIAEVTNFTWDSMHIFSPYTSAAAVDQALGFKWPEYQSLGIDSNDAHDLLVFVSHDRGNKQVVKFAKYPRKLSSFRQTANGYGYSPAQAVFAVSTKAEYKLLMSVNEPQKPTLSVTDIIPTQPGIYNVEAWFFFTQPGRISVKVFNTKTQQPVMMKHTQDNLKLRSNDTPDGWSKEGQNLFPYRSQIMIQEGDWDHQYETRWELWQQQPDGQNKKLLETTRLVNGWER